MSDPEREDTEEADECCRGLDMDMGESALWGELESLCSSAALTAGSGSASDATSLERETLVRRWSQKSCHSRANGLPVRFRCVYVCISLEMFLTTALGSCQLPAPPLLDDPLPVVDHLLGQPEDPPQSAAGRKEVLKKRVWPKGPLVVIRVLFILFKINWRWESIKVNCITWNPSQQDIPPATVFVGVRPRQGWHSVAEDHVCVVKHVLHVHGAIRTPANVVA